MPETTGGLFGQDETLFESLEWMHENVVVSRSFLKNYGIEANALLGKTVFEMEQQGISRW